MAAMVETQDAEAVFEQGDLVVPQAQVIAERMAERDPWCALYTFDFAIELKIPDADFHRFFLFRVFIV